MSAALMYCENKFKKSLRINSANEKLYKSFEALELEIKKQDYMVQLHLYAAASQFLDSLITEPHDSINPLELFSLRCHSVIDGQKDKIDKIVLGLGVIVISLAAVAAGIALGAGVGALLAVWQTPMVFMTALYAAELPAVLIASSSVITGIGAGALSHYLFFKEPQIKSMLNVCIDTVKQSHLTQNPIEVEEEWREQSNATYA